ncbi:hypothetical protein HPB47_013689 [Ixodes persulcatus]|uniref:Uncharacterized protein n=1 Tax=Ixodes persulcatus TaxID=34615 RepID=A0AC60QXY5_IXOPE|nr:hypothetical protein HPB47_013689 [Ixodes persulcatus]
MQPGRRAVVAALLTLGVFLAVSEPRAVRYRCQYLKTHNRSGIVCTPVDGPGLLGGPKPKTFTAPEAFNGNFIRHRESACGNLQRLAEQLKDFQHGSWKYCDPTLCLREARSLNKLALLFSVLPKSPHCSKNTVNTDCARCFGRCWLMYGYPSISNEGVCQGKSYPCDPTSCGIHVFCGGYKFTDDDEKKPPKPVV